LSKHYLGVQAPLTHQFPPARDIALEHVRSLASDLNLTGPDLAGLYIVKEYDTAHNGVHHIIFKQRSRVSMCSMRNGWSISIATAPFLNSGGNLYSAPPPDVLLPAQSSAMSAVRVAVRAVNVKLAESFLPFVSARPSARTNGVRFTAGPLPEDIDGELVWFALRGQLHAAWLFNIVDADGINSYATVVDNASNPSFQAAHNLLPIAAERIGLRARKPSTKSTPGVRLTGPPPLVQRTSQPFTGDPVASPRGW